MPADVFIVSHLKIVKNEKWESRRSVVLILQQRSDNFSIFHVGKIEHKTTPEPHINVCW